MSSSFVHLHVHTEYSLVDSILRIGPLVEAVRAAGMPALAVTEQSNLFSMVKFYQAALAEGVKPLIGADLWIRNEDELNQPTRLVLLCQNEEGYRRLCKLVSRSYVEGQHRGTPMLERGWLEGMTQGLIALSGSPAGDIGQALLAGRDEEARRRLAVWQRLFPERFYLQLQRTHREGEEQVVRGAVELASAAGVPVVATNETCFLQRSDFEAHEARVCIREGRTLADPRRQRRYSEEQYLKSPAEMAELFADVPESVENALEIARRCSVELRLGRHFLPAFPVPEGKAVEGWLDELSKQGLEARLDSLQGTPGEIPATRHGVYRDRLQKELDVITSMGFSGYFLIVADFIQWAKQNGIPVGPGRGSGAGSLVAYALGITDLDPIRYELLFERFLNPERVSLPDFDIDFCMDGRDRVLDYVTSRYGGEEQVSQIITFGTMAAKAVVRDVGRVLGYPYGFVDQIAKLVPFELGITLERALAEEEVLRARYETEDDVRTLIDLARKLEGLVRNAGRHAGGLVIAPSSLTDFTPVYREQGSSTIVTQLDKDDVEAVGLVKFDFLGLRTLTIIDRAVGTVNEVARARGEPPMDIDTIPMDDTATYELIKSGATTAVFQLESRGMKDLIRRLQPDTFEEIIALVALFRPGPLQSGMVDDFIARKHGAAPVAYTHPDLEPILKPSYGVILYQEQVMQIAQVLAGYTLGEADLLRRAMGKKKPAEMAKQRAVFMQGAAERGVAESTASHIFDLMEKFAGYGFNKSHSAAYALIAYQTAWLKAHHAAAYMAAVLSADMDHTDKVVVFVDECRVLGLTVLPPNVNDCQYAFTVQDESTIRYGLGAIKGVGKSAIDAIIAERERAGAYRDLFDFCERIDMRRVNRRVVEALIRSGALNDLGPSRAAMMRSLTQAMQAAEQTARDRSLGQNDLFGEAVQQAVPREHRVAEVEEWSEEERLVGEKETLGLYLTGHPIARFEDELAQFTSSRLVDLKAVPGQNLVVAGLVVKLTRINSRSGRGVSITLDDRTARVEAVLYAEEYQHYREIIGKDKLLVAVGEVTPDSWNGGSRMVVRQLYDMTGAREAFARVLRIQVDSRRVENEFIESLAEALEPFREGCTPVCIEYLRPGACVKLPLGTQWRVRPSDELLGRLRRLAGEGGVALAY